jgi:hypothetical protein
MRSQFDEGGVQGLAYSRPAFSTLLANSAEPFCISPGIFFIATKNTRTHENRPHKTNLATINTKPYQDQ